MRLVIAWLQHFLYPAFLFLILPLVALYAACRGVMYWVDVWGRPNAQKVITLQLEEIGDVQIFYPKSIQLNVSEAEHIELEFEPLQSPGHTDLLMLTFDESSDHISLVPEEVELSVSDPPSPPPSVAVEVRDLDGPPASVDIVVVAREPQSGNAAQQIVGVTIDNTLWRIVAGFTALGGMATFLGAVLGLRKWRSNG